MAVEGLFVLPGPELGGVQALVDEVLEFMQSEGYRPGFIAYLADGDIEIVWWKDGRLASLRIESVGVGAARLLIT